MKSTVNMRAYICVAVLRREHEGGEALVLHRLYVGVSLEQVADNLLVI